MEGQRVHQRLGEQIVVIQKIGDMHHQIGQKRHFQQSGGQFDGEAVVVRPAAFLDGFFYSCADLEDGVAGVEFHLDGVFLRMTVFRGPQDDETYRQLGAVVEFPIHG